MTKTTHRDFVKFSHKKHTAKQKNIARTSAAHVPCRQKALLRGQDPEVPEIEREGRRQQQRTAHEHRQRREQKRRRRQFRPLERPLSLSEKKRSNGHREQLHFAAVELF